MRNHKARLSIAAGVAAVLAASTLTWGSVANAQALEGGTLDPLSIPKYVTPLVIPPVMKDTAGDNLTNDYDIAVRQFQQQILPGGHWKTLAPKCAATPRAPPGHVKQRRNSDPCAEFLYSFQLRGEQDAISAPCRQSATTD